VIFKSLALPFPDKLRSLNFLETDPISLKFVVSGIIFVETFVKSPGPPPPLPEIPVKVMSFVPTTSAPAILEQTNSLLAFAVP
jgi:hypothetical protein